MKTRTCLSLLLHIAFVGFIAPTALAQRPNIIVINLDDADSETLSDANILNRYPNMARFVNDGLRFTNLHVTTPICGPSRACFLRCQYAHRTGIRINDPNSPKSNGFDGGMQSYFEACHFENDLSVWMQGAGYRTMMVGKFLHADFMPYIPPGWDDFYHSLGGKYFATNRFTNRLDPGGRFEIQGLGDYRTAVEARDVVQLINTHADRNNDQPFFMYLNPFPPHRQGDNNPMVESRYARWWTQAQVRRLPDFNEADVSDKSSPLKNLPLMSGSRLDYVDSHYLERLQSLRSFDDMLGELFATLEERDLANSTYIFLTSDNGFLLGHQRYFGKSVPLDRATRVPLLVLGPGIPQARKANHLLAHIDIAATVADLAGATLPSDVDGVSFAPLLFEPDDFDARTWRTPVLIQTWGSTTTLGYHELIDIASTSVRYYDSIYTEWADGSVEYYDFTTDPLQLVNMADDLDPAERSLHQLVLRSLKRPFMDPIVTVADPFETATTVPRQVHLAGMAEDDFGVQRVKLAIQDTTTREFWNGSDWSPEFQQVDAALANREGLITEWHYRDTLPFSRVPDGPVRFWVWAYDAGGNYNRSAVSSVFEIDREAPSSRFTSPPDNATASGVFAVSGTAEDNVAVSEIQLVVRRIDDGRYWNGVQLQTGWTYVSPSLDDNTWRTNLSLPAGRYVLTLRVMDESRNLASELPRRHITVD